MCLVVGVLLWRSLIIQLHTCQSSDKWEKRGGGEREGGRGTWIGRGGDRERNRGMQRGKEEESKEELNDFRGNVEARQGLKRK